MSESRGLYRRTYDRLLEGASSPNGIRLIGVVSFAEASFFPIPPDVLLIGAVLARPAVWLRAALVCSLASIAGGLAGYLLGWGVWELVSGLFFTYVPGFSEASYARVAQLYERWNFWIVFTAGFTPIPYKIFTIGAGVAHINVVVFLLASAVSRSARFFLVAGLLRKFGPWIKPILDRYLWLFTILFTALLIGGFLLVKALAS